MKRGALALIIIGLVLVMLGMISIGISPTGYVVSEDVQKQIDSILATKNVESRATVATAPTTEGTAVQAQTLPEAEEEEIIKQITAVQRGETNIVTRTFRKFFRNKLDADGDGVVALSDAVLFVKERNYAAAEQVFETMYGGEPLVYQLSTGQDTTTFTTKGLSGTYEQTFIPLQTNSSGNSTNSTGGSSSSSGSSSGGGTPGGLPMPPVCTGTFVRGNVNNDQLSLIDIADVIYALEFLFQTGNAPPCGDIADINDDNVLDISDPVYLLGYLFGNGGQPYEPFPTTGYDEQGEGALTGSPWSLCDGINNDAATGDLLCDEGEGCPGPNGCGMGGGNPTNNTNSTNSTNPTMHLECVGLQCLPVPGAGANLCATDFDCMNTTNTSLPDLVVAFNTTVLNPSTNSTNGTVLVGLVVTNVGQASAGPSQTSLAIALSGSLYSQESLATPALTPGASASLFSTLSSFPGGSYTTDASADAGQAVAESNENNNDATGSFIVP